jgi:hypothetical protein
MKGLNACVESMRADSASRARMTTAFSPPMQWVQSHVCGASHVMAAATANVPPEYGR